MTPRQFDAFVFDLDGTLVDTASELVAAYQRLCVEYGTGEQPYETVRKLISHGSGRLVTKRQVSIRVIAAGRRIGSNTSIGTKKSWAQVLYLIREPWTWSLRSRTRV